MSPTPTPEDLFENPLKEVPLDMESWRIFARERSELLVV
jgi:hypothetical protein